jgi:tryptophan synthase alpha chain
MNRIDSVFRGLRRKKEGAFIAFITAGDPDYETSLAAAGAIIKGGADILELGLPFSDPIADGPVIQQAGQRSLAAGMNTDVFFRFAGELRARHAIPLLCMTYYNLLFHRGLDTFTSECKKSGIDGLIIPDLPVEESKPLLTACNKNGIRLVFMAAPTTTDRRLKAIAQASKGFLYVVSVKGITGVRKDVSGDVRPLVKRIRKLDKTIPLAVGFGISKPEHVKAVLESGADGAIVGSALINIIEKNLEDKGKMPYLLEKFAVEMKKAAASQASQLTGISR